MTILSMQKTSPENSVGWWTEEDLAEKETDSMTEPFLSDDTAHNYAIRDLLKLNFSDYCLSHPVPEFKLKTLHAMISCKTGKLGYNLIHCSQCGKIEMRPCSCGNRNCPSCGYLEEKRWTSMRQSEVIPGIPYFHLVFTLPHTLADIMYQNQKDTLNLLFSAAKETILELSMKKLKMTPGILMILHSFGSDLSLHYHLHVLVSGGGLTKDKTRFKRCLSNHFFLPLKAVTKVYSGKFMAGLKKLHDDEKLQYFHAAQKYRNSYEWKDLLNKCYNTTWNVEIKPLAPVKKSGGKTMGLHLLFTVRACLPCSKILYFIHNCEKVYFLKGNTPPRRASWESGQKNFLYKEVHRVRTDADSVQKKYFPDCLVKTGLFLCHV